MSNINDLNQFWQEPFELVEADPAVCQNIKTAVCHTWDVVLKRLSDYKPPCSNMNVVTVVALPTKKEAFQFTVEEGSYRVVHLSGWDYSCNADGIVLERVSYGVFSKCGDNKMVYQFPRSCPFTILPPGTYRAKLLPVPVGVDETVADGVDFKVSIIMEHVTQQFVDAVSVTRG